MMHPHLPACPTHTFLLVIPKNPNLEVLGDIEVLRLAKPPVETDISEVIHT